MPGLQIRDGRADGATSVPNRFIDGAMLRANGDFVKVYLLLLRLAQQEAVPCGLSALADLLSCTENDIRRALRYWENEGLLALSVTGGALTGIELLSPERPAEPAPGPSGSAAASSAQPKATAAALTAAARTRTDAAGADAAQKRMRPSDLMTTARAGQIRKNDREAEELINIVKQYFVTAGKGDIKPTYIRALFYFYDELHFSADLLDYLVQYCLEYGSASVEYLEAVGLAWHSEGITTLRDAKAHVRMRKKYRAIFKYFSISDDPLPEDISYMDRWLNDYKFSLGIIERAAHKTRRSTSTRSRAALFSYAESILKDWKEKNVRTLDDAVALDAEFRARKSSEAADGQERRNEPAQKKSSYHNRYNDFPQRDNDYKQIQEDWIRTQFGK